MAAALDPETLLTTILEGIGHPFYAVDRDWRIMLYNSEAERHFGRPKDEMIGRVLWDVLPDRYYADGSRILREAMASRRVVRGETASIAGPWVSYCLFPLGDGMGISIRDESHRHAAEAHRDQAQEVLRKRSMELETVLETVPTAVWFTYDPLVRSMVTNRRAAELLGLPRAGEVSLEGLGGKDAIVRFYRDGEQLLPEAMPVNRAVRGEEVKDEVLEMRTAAGEQKLLLVRAAALRDPDGRIQGAVAAAADVTERHRYEEHLKLLLYELSHRVKNTLATVQSIALQTMQGADNPAEALQRFEGRLVALARAHDVLTRKSWQGAGLQQVVGEATAPVCGEDASRFTTEGPDATVPPRYALALAMALHELCTNAVKYGALSASAGRVEIKWDVTGSAQDRRLKLTWRERGGPGVAPPLRRGFGTRLIERGLAHDLGGSAHIEFDPAGLVCIIDAPLPADATATA